MSAEEMQTRPSLLVRLRDAENAEAWGQFVEIYTPILYRFLRSQDRDLQDADACDIAQEVLRVVARSMREFEYNPQRGRFRSWLLTATRRKLIDFKRVQDRKPIPIADSAMEAVIDAEPTEPERARWDAEYHGRLFEWAAAQIRPKVNEATWSAFWRTAVEDEDPNAVAADLGISIGSVYVAKSRVMARFEAVLRSVDEEADVIPQALRPL